MSQLSRQSWMRSQGAWWPRLALGVAVGAGTVALPVLTPPGPGAIATAMAQMPANPPGASVGVPAGLPDIVALVERQKSSVVSVRTEEAEGMPQEPSPFFGPGPGPGQGQPRIGQGSGFVVDAAGFILTNYHVVQGAQSITVGFETGESLSAELVGADQATDIALLKVNANRKFVPVRLGDSRRLRAGDWVVAIGNPFGLEHSVTVGVVSATGRRIGAGPYDNFLQTDASINPGNSGGPLFNLAGEVVGVNTAIIRNGQGIGFAVPMDMVERILPQLRDKGFVTRGYMGAGIQDLGDELAQSFGVDRQFGVLVGSVEQGGPAQRAGLRPGDIVVRFSGKAVRDTSELLRAVAEADPGSRVAVDYWRDGDTRTAQIAVSERPDSTRAAMEGQRPRTNGAPATARLGIAVRPVTPAIAQRLGLEPNRGVLVDGIDQRSPANRVLRRGDVILQINGAPINSPEELARAMQRAPANRPLRLLVQREGSQNFVAIPQGP